MRGLQIQAAVALLALLSACAVADARRVRVSRVRPATSEEADGVDGLDQDGVPQQVQYYAAPDARGRADARSGRVVLLAADADADADADALNGLSPSLYADPGRSVTRAPAHGAVYRAAPSPRALNAAQAIAPRQHASKEQNAKAPPVQTIRNYSKVNDDGSFTFGYEAADGSFKEETRGTDCVVRGKYGYVDPDGNKREFTYVSGNPCDPNAVNQDDELPGGGKLADAEADSGEENIPANFPSRSLRPARPAARPARPTTTLFQQNYNQDSEEDADDEDLPVPARARVVRPTPVPAAAAPTPSPARPRLIVTTPRPTTTLYQPTAAPVRITPRPYSNPTSTAAPEPPATTYRPQVAQVSQSPRPASYAPFRSSTPSTIDFAAELRKFQLDNNVVSTTGRPRPGPAPAGPGSDPIYSTELVFDPASGQYNTVVYQSLPKPQQPQPQQQQDISAAVQRHRLQPYVAPQQHQQPSQQLPPPGSLYQQQLVQQQQQTLLQQSQQLFAQQQRSLAAAAAASAASASPYHAPRYQPGQLQIQSSTASPVKLAPPPARYLSQQPVQYASPSAPIPQSHGGHSGAPQTQFYYVSPQDAGDQRAALAAGQIDAFLRGHNLSF